MWISHYLPFAFVTFAASAVCAATTAYAWRRRQAPGIRLFALMMAALAWAAFFSAVDYLLSAEALRAKIVVAQLYLIGGGAASLLVLLFALRYTHHDRWLTPAVQWFLWLALGVEMVVAFTNDWHHQYWPSFGVTGAGPEAMVIYGHSPITHLFAALLYLRLLAAAGLLLFSALRAPAIYRRQSTLFVLAVLIPLLANLVYYLGAGPWDHFDLTPISFAVSGSLLALAIFRYQAVDLTPVALDTLVATLNDGVLVINARGLIVSANPAARALLALTENRLLGRPVAQLAAPWAAALTAVMTAVHRDAAAAQEVELPHLHPPRTVELTASALRDHTARLVGSTVVLHDVTGYRTLQRHLAQANADLEARVAARTAELSAMRDALAEHVANLSRHLSVLYEVILLGGQSLDMDAVRDQALATVMAALQADTGFIVFWNSAAGASQMAAVKGLTGEDAARLCTLPTEWLFGESVPHTILDLQGANVPAALRLPQMRSCLTCSVQRQGVPVAAIGIFWQHQPALSVEAIALFRGLVDQMAILAENARLRQIQDESLVQEERSRLARELHDSVTQALYALALNAETAANAVQHGRSEGLEGRLGRIAAAARQALREMRLLLYELRLAGPQRPPLAEALRLRLDAVESRAGIAVALAVDPHLPLPPAWEQDFYWIAMEALNNALKHAAAAHVAVSLAQHGGTIELSVCDDGCGMNPEQATNGGLGLRSMQERAAQLGGSLAVTTGAAGRGVAVRLCVPLPAGPATGLAAAGRGAEAAADALPAPQLEKNL
jgi:PAS domain S-box-containing protein